MLEPDSVKFAAEASNMTDEELMDTWRTASDDERQHPSGYLQAVIDEMKRRDIPL